VDQASLNAHETTLRRRDRRTLLLATSLSFLLFLIVVACLPRLGPFLRIYGHPSASMLPKAVGSYRLVSCPALGYRRYSLKLPIDGRLPELLPRCGEVIVFRLRRDHATQYIKRVIGLPGDGVRMIKGRLSLNGEPVAMEPITGAVAATDRSPLGT
jgi:signal peptidase I